MNARETFVVVLVVSLALVPVLSVVPIHAQTQYSEKIDVYAAGSDAYWLMTMNRLNSSLAGLSSAEASSGATSYRIMALSAQAATSDMQIFGVDGYNVLKVPSLPSQGLFLTINASGASGIASLVTYFGTKFGTTFTLASSGSGTFVYFAPVNFAGLAAPVLFKLVPTTMKGFASFLNVASFVALAMPSIAVSGFDNCSGFSHSITIGASSSGVLSSGNAISLSKVLSNANGVVKASSSASSSLVVVHALDGVVQSTDKATVSNDPARFTGTYLLSPNAGSTVKANVTIVNQVPTAIAYRVFDRGSVATNQSLAVTIVVRDTAQSGSIQNVTVNDNWWQSYPTVFQFQGGNYSFTIPIITAGQNLTESYVLKVLTASSVKVTVPSATASFQYLLSSTSYRSEAILNTATIQVNNVGPSISVTARSSISSGAPLGTPGNFTVTVTNNGNSPALDIKVGGTSITNLVQGSSHTVNIPVTLGSTSLWPFSGSSIPSSFLVQRNLTRTFSVQFTDSAQKTQNVSSNSVSLFLSHSSMVIPFVQVTTNDTLTSRYLASRALNVTYSFTNKGSGASGSVSATQALPSGTSCMVVKGAGTCAAGPYSVTIPALVAQGGQVSKLRLTLTADNLIIQPASVVTSYEGASLHTFGGAYVIPAGVVVAKSLGIKAGFPDMTTSVTLGINNVGTSPVFNATLSSTEDSFDFSASGASFTKTFPTVAPQQSESFSYSVTLAEGAYGNQSTSPVIVQLIFGGLITSFASSSPYVQVYRPISVSIATNPSSPVENHDFTMSITFRNPSGVAVSDASYSFKIPSGLSLVSGGQVSGQTVTLSVPALAAGSNQTVSVTFTSSTGLTINTASSHLTYQYQNSTLIGLTPSQSITVGADVTTRYTLPIILAIFIAFAGLVYMRRRINPAVKT